MLSMLTREHSLCVDGVALAPHRQVDVQAWAFSWYKVYGPHLAQLDASARIHDQIDSLAHSFKPTDTLDQKLNLASADYELTASIPAVVAYFGPDPTATWAGMVAHEERMPAILLQFLSRMTGSQSSGERSAAQELRVPVVSFVVRGVKSQRLVEAVEARSRYEFRSGHMYSRRLLRDVCGLEDVDDGVVRVSLLHYNTEAEVVGLVTVLQLQEALGGAIVNDHVLQTAVEWDPGSGIGRI